MSDLIFLQVGRNKSLDKYIRSRIPLPEFKHLILRTVDISDLMFKPISHNFQSTNRLGLKSCKILALDKFDLQMHIFFLIDACITMGKILTVPKGLCKVPNAATSIVLQIGGKGKEKMCRGLCIHTLSLSGGLR